MAYDNVSPNSIDHIFQGGKRERGSLNGHGKKEDLSKPSRHQGDRIGSRMIKEYRNQNLIVLVIQHPLVFIQP